MLDPSAIPRSYPRDLQPRGPLERVTGSGGASGARVWKYPASRGWQALRAWPPGPASGREILGQLHRWIGWAADLPFIPMPWRGTDGETLQGVSGGWWEITPWMPGVPDLGEPPGDGRIRAAFGALGLLHTRLARKPERGPSPAIARRSEELEVLVEGGYARLARMASGATNSEPGRLAAEWLGRAGAKAPEVLSRLREARGRSVDLQPCQRDTRPEHFLFTGDRLTGLVDFGAMGVECVAGDLARLLADWIGPDPGLRLVAVDAYGEINPAAAESLSLMSIFEESQAVMGGGRWINWVWAEGRKFEPGTVEAGLRRSIKRLETLDRLQRS